MVNSTSCSFRGPGFNSHPPSGSSQPFMTAVLGDLASSSAIHRHQACTWCTDPLHAGKTSTTFCKWGFIYQKDMFSCLCLK